MGRLRSLRTGPFFLPFLRFLRRFFFYLHVIRE
jgi:hypothetical protein